MVLISAQGGQRLNVGEYFTIKIVRSKDNPVIRQP
jgi:hypothetical protein